MVEIQRVAIITKIFHDAKTKRTPNVLPVSMDDKRAIWHQTKCWISSF